MEICCIPRRLATFFVIFLACGAAMAHPGNTPSDGQLRPKVYDWDSFMEKYLKQFLVRRYVGSEPLAELRGQIVTFLESLGWTVELHTFLQKVPDVDDIMNGEKEFNNIIATWEPERCEKRIFACHYESKYFNKDSNFIGAMDSAVPCAILLSSAELISDVSQNSSSDLVSSKACVPGTTSQLVFFDGEEAIKSWTTGDKLYGSTALANLWAEQGELGNIELFVLLDLLGFKVGWECTLCPKIISYREETQSEYDQLVSIEAALKSTGQLAPIPDVDPVTNASFSGYLFGPEASYWLGSFLDDDHAPFELLGVERILHLIPFPFPKGHHTENDSEEGLDQATTLNTELILRCFICSLSVDDPSACCNL